MKQQKLVKKRLCEINSLKNLGHKLMLQNYECSFEKVEEWQNKYCHAVTRYNNSMDEIESKLRSLKEMEKKNRTK